MENLTIKGLIANDDFITETILTALARSENQTEFNVTAQSDLSNYYVLAQSEKRCGELRKKYNVNAVTDINEFIDKTALLIVTSKYDDAKDTLSKIADKVSDDTLIVSIIEGIGLVFIQDFFPKNSVVRLTINPSIISGEGLSAFVAGNNVSDASKKIIRDMLLSFGKIIEVNNEEEFEKVRKFILANTFLAYIIIKSMRDAAFKNGYSTEQTSLLIDQILKGASKTLIEFQHMGNEMIKDGFKHTNITNYAVDLIREYGIYDSIERYLTTKELQNIFDFYTEEEEKHYKVNFDWFEDAVSK